MKSILVPTDFSLNANTAIDYACELARSLGAEVTVLNIHTPAITQYDVASVIVKNELDRAKEIAEEKLGEISKMIQQQYQITCKTRFKVGGVVDSIEDMIEKEEADFVIMGTRGASGLGKILFGSNTARVIEKVDCPVLAIPEGCTFQNPKRIVYATDFNNAELNHLDKLVAVAQSFNSELMMVHITTDKEALQSEEMLKRNFARKVSELTDYNAITYFAKYEENIVRALDSFTQQVRADWIAMLTHNRSGFEKFYNPSLTKKMAYQTKIPLLAIKN
ncbi:MAG TPA: universal stress protein [Cyclobacteriaceae bacterium]|nr:universal stress protein [Cyclobacteriaceae bacterium]HRK54376.1 universal stress protein [Cyclobacteriaceae bacterium]